MKIALISEHYPPTSGGVATSTKRLSENFNNLNHETFVISFDATRPLESEDFIIEEKYDKTKLYRVGPFFIKQKFIDRSSIPEKVKAIFRRRVLNLTLQILKKEKPDIILSFYLLNAGYISLFASRELKIPIVAGIRGNDIGRNIFHAERFSVIDWVVNGADYLISVNNHLRNRTLLAFPNVHNKISVIHNGIGIKKFVTDKIINREKILRHTNWNDDDLIVVFAGNFREKKGVSIFVNALLKVNNKKIKLLLIGPEIGGLENKMIGEKWDKLKQQNQVYITGHLERENVAEWLIGGDIVLMPSFDDGMANSLLEGMLLGLAPLVSPIFNDIITHGKTGMIMDDFDSKSIIKLLKYYHINRDKIKILGTNASKYIVANHKPINEVKKYIEVFKKILNEKNSTL